MNKALNKRNIAVIGGGVYGCTVAIFLAREKFNVSLYEKAADIMTAASSINQYRLHRGYHYPRSVDTILSCLNATPSFEDEYDKAIIRHNMHHYCIAKKQSLVNGIDYLKILNQNDLPYIEELPAHINPDTVDIAIRVQENLYSPFILARILKNRMKKNGVKIYLNTKVEVDDLDKFDHVVVATYASLNAPFVNKPEMQRKYQFEVCEKIVIEVPESIRKISTVIMDGPFMSFDPLGDAGYAVMGHVEHAIHSRNIGLEPEVPKAIQPILNRGLIKNPPITNIQHFIEAGSYFMPALKKARYVGSMYTVRTVLPKVDDTDTRPTIVTKIDDRIITIYSGKVGNSVQAAKNVIALLRD